jgi:DNA uptake protein ComE-like DNA-binding protein
MAACAPDRPIDPRPAGPARLLGLKFDLNAVTENELGQVAGIGPALAHALVEARDAGQGFHGWDDVDAVRGVGPAKLRLLQEVGEIRR